MVIEKRDRYKMKLSNGNKKQKEIFFVMVIEWYKNNIFLAYKNNNIPFYYQKT